MIFDPPHQNFLDAAPGAVEEAGAVRHVGVELLEALLAALLLQLFVVVDAGAGGGVRAVAVVTIHTGAVLTF